MRLSYKYRKKLKKYDNQLPDKQRYAFLKILKNVASQPNVSINELNVEVSADEEISLSRKTEKGAHYILVGDDLNDVSYLFISNQPGYYSSLHVGENAGIKNIIDTFLNDERTDSPS